MMRDPNELRDAFRLTAGAMFDLGGKHARAAELVLVEVSRLEEIERSARLLADRAGSGPGRWKIPAGDVSRVACAGCWAVFDRDAIGDCMPGCAARRLDAALGLDEHAEPRRYAVNCGGAGS